MVVKSGERVVKFVKHDLRSCVTTTWHYELTIEMSIRRIQQSLHEC